MKTALLLGGTGAMGTHLQRILLDKGIEVFVTSRRKLISENTHLHYIQGNAKDDIFLNSLLRNRYDFIIDFMVYSLEAFQHRINKLLEATEQYVFLSSARVYANSDMPITEDSPRLLDICEDYSYTSMPEYAIVKAKEEDILQNNIHTNWTIIRPYITYDENRMQLGVMEKESWLYRALHNRSIVFSADIASHTTTLTYGYDVALGISAILGQQSALQNIFHITGPYSIKWKEVAGIYQDTIEIITGKRPNIILTKQAINLSFPNKKWQVKVDRLYDRVFDNSRINKYIDTSTFTDPRDGLRNCLTTFLKKPEFKEINMFENMIMDKLAKENTNFSEFANKKEYLYYLKWRWFDPLSKFLKKI